MIRAILKKGKIQPLDRLPPHWHDGQQLVVECGAPSDDEEDIQKWYEKLMALSAQIPAQDHERMAAAIAEQARDAKKQMRKDQTLERQVGPNHDLPQTEGLQ